MDEPMRPAPSTQTLDFMVTSPIALSTRDWFVFGALIQRYIFLLC
ncbi:hypothetical protein X734_22820 [Mesorhizobium sp. L2C084A000]|nr:hypothetical protein X734_22820 [Mesorhizobium sp. L2C084A000]